MTQSKLHQKLVKSQYLAMRETNSVKVEANALSDGSESFDVVVRCGDSTARFASIDEDHAHRLAHEIDKFCAYWEITA